MTFIFLLICYLHHRITLKSQEKVNQHRKNATMKDQSCNHDGPRTLTLQQRNNSMTAVNHHGSPLPAATTQWMFINERKIVTSNTTTCDEYCLFEKNNFLCHQLKQSYSRRIVQTIHKTMTTSIPVSRPVIKIHFIGLVSYCQNTTTTTTGKTK